MDYKSLVHIILFKYYTSLKDMYYIYTSNNIKELNKKEKEKIKYHYILNKYGEKILSYLSKKDQDSLDNFYENQFANKKIEEKYPNIEINDELIDSLPNIEKIKYLLFNDISVEENFLEKVSKEHKY